MLPGHGFADITATPGQWHGRAEAGPALVGWAASGDRPAPARQGPVDARRVAGFDAGRRAAFLTGRALLAELLSVRFGDAGRVDTAPCPRCGGEHGPVLVEGLPAIATVAYTQGLVVAAVAADAHALRLGVDVEAATVDPVRDADLGRLLGVRPGRALRRWTEVEAVLKATGRGLRTDPGQVQVKAGTARIAGTAQVAATAETYRLARVDGPAGYELSVAWQPRD